MRWPRYYVLHPDRTAHPTDDADAWARAFGKERVVGHWIYGDVLVSTVFLGLDHNFSGSGLPLLFETMIFGGAYDQEQWRCSTWKEAEAQHERAMRLVNGEERSLTDDRRA